MDQVLDLVVCSHYQKEVEAVIRLKGWDNVRVITDAGLCGNSRKPGISDHDAFTSLADKNNVVVIHCGQSQPDLPAASMHQLPHCFYMLLNRTVIDDAVRRGQYLLLPGWLKNWRRVLDSWGFDQLTARQFFHDSVNGLLLLDTGMEDDSQSQLAAMSEYLDLPAVSIPVGLDHLSLYLSQIVSEWRSKTMLAEVEKRNTEAQRTVSDYAMVVDMLTQLTQIHSVEEAHRLVADLFTMMFFQDTVVYLPVKDGILNTNQHSFTKKEGSALQGWITDSRDPYQRTSSGTGFYLRIEHMGHPLGLVVAENLTRPEYLDQYLNLSTMIAGVCGLSIANASNYQKLIEAEAEARREREISDTLRETMLELSSELSLQELLQRILVSLHRVIPYTESLVYLKRGTTLEFKAGLKVDPSGNFDSHSPQEIFLKIDAPWLRTDPLTIHDARQNAQRLGYLNLERMKSWIGLPLAKHGEVIGFLSIGNLGEDTYTDESIKMAQVFGAEVSIALENARLFSDLTEAAITDGLTGLFNRRHFYSLVGVEFTRSKRYRHPMSLVLIDIDFFKRINDQHGHLVGDQVLRWFAGVCKDTKRESDILARYGGEEFVLLLPETDTARAMTYAERLRIDVAKTPAPTSAGPLSVTCSLGVASLTPDMNELDQLLEKADAALYDAKHEGRNRVRSRDYNGMVFTSSDEPMI